MKDLRGYILRSDIAGSCGICIYSLIRDCQISVQRDYTSFHHYQHYIKVPITLHPHLYLEVSYLINFANLRSVKCYLTAILICLSLISCEVEHLFMYLSAIWLSSFVNWLVYYLLLCVCVCVCVFFLVCSNLYIFGIIIL